MPLTVIAARLLRHVETEPQDALGRNSSLQRKTYLAACPLDNPGTHSYAFYHLGLPWRAKSFNRARRPLADL